MIRSLLWKEWREQRWRLAFGCVIVIGSTSIALRTHIAPYDESLMVLLLTGGLLLPLLVAVGTVGTEREDRSIPFMLSLPVKPGTLLAVKMTVALLTVLLPVAGAFLAELLLANGRDPTWRQSVYLTGLTVWMATNLLIWTVSFGITQPTEARVGLVGLAVVTAWMFDAGLIEAMTRGRGAAYYLFILPNPLFGSWAIDIVRFVPQKRPFLVFAYFLVQACIVVALLLWASRRIAVVKRGES